MLRRVIDFITCKKKSDETVNILYAFDFDQTILNLDSEIAISSILRSKIPSNIIEFYTGGNWAAYCQLLIDHVIFTDGVSLDEIIESVKRLELLPGMKQLLDKIKLSVDKNLKSHFIVISGSNNLFVQVVLSNLDPPIIPHQIISNTATRVNIPPQPHLIFKAHDNDQRICHKCPKNLCKGAALLKYIEDNGPFGIIYYAGDGPNDVCPAMKLKSTDVLFVRKNHVFEKVISNGYFAGEVVDIKAKILYFETGEDIEQNMKF